MQKNRSGRSGCLGFFAMTAMLMFASICCAQIYKYKNQDGVWVFTDTPQELPKKGVNVIDSIGSESDPSGPGEDLGKHLIHKLKPGNDIEKAALGVVAIQSTLGYGTGFFVTSNGYIITNKHVLQLTESESQKRETHRAMAEDEIKKIETNLEIEAGKLELFKKDLENYKKYISSVTRRNEKEYAQKNYDIELKKYQSWNREFQSRKQEFERKLSEYRNRQIDQKYNETLAYFKSSFIISLADNSQKTARLVKISDTHDLALLKLDGYTTPTLEPAGPGTIFQGKKVYAIGNPAQLKNSVSAGVMSGREGVFIKTDAKIYPGNSGGPLITPQGQVLGINTFKRLTHKFEGLGFAISMQTALLEFGSYISR